MNPLSVAKDAPGKLPVREDCSFDLIERFGHKQVRCSYLDHYALGSNKRQSFRLLLEAIREDQTKKFYGTK